MVVATSIGIQCAAGGKLRRILGVVENGHEEEEEIQMVVRVGVI